MSKNGTVIVWAIDPYNTNKSHLTKSVVYLEKLARDMGAKIKPTYILSPYMYYTPLDHLIPPSEADFVRQAEVKLQEIVKSFKSKNFLAGEVLLDESSSLRGSVNTFIENAKDQKAICIFATTHARRGLPRFWLGSFVETLVMQSSVPVISLNPATKSPLNITSILLPTDLKDASKKSILKILPLAKKLGAKVYLLHVLRDVEAFSVGGAPYMTPVSQEFYAQTIQDIKQDTKANLDKLVARCKKSGVSCEGIFVNTIDSVTDVILRVAKQKKIKLVAMSAVSGPIETLVTGGVTRQVVRYGECPTWVVH